MKTTLLAGALALATLPAVAKNKVEALAPAAAAALQGKTVALTSHETPDFAAMTAGKATFAMFGAFAMIKAGNDLVRENQIADPALTVRDQLAAGLRDAYGATLLPADTAPTKAKKPKELAASHTDADYVLDVRTRNWMYVYYPGDWNNYHVVYSVSVQLVSKDGRQLSEAVCTAGSQPEKTPPTREQLHADGAKLLKDYNTALAWNCVQALGPAQFGIAADKLSPTPEPYASMLLRFTGGDVATAAAPAVAAPAAPASAGETAPPAETKNPEPASGEG